MIKRIIKNSGMQDMFIQQEIKEKTALFETASERIQKDIDDLEKSIERQDYGLSYIEDRNELLYLKGELRHLEENLYSEISRLKAFER